jgi:hypothetical protein
MEPQPKSPWANLPERRNNRRRSLTVAVLKSVGEETCLCQSVDISPSGMSMRRPKGLPMTPEVPVFLKFSLPGSEEVHRITGLVVRDDSVGRYWESAVVFGPLPDRLKRQIDVLVSEI